MRYLIPVSLALFVALGGIGLVYAVDTDGDIWSDAFEGYLGTLSNDNCTSGGITPSWPPDMNVSASVDTADIAAVTFWFGRPVGVAPARIDIDHPLTQNQGSGFIDTGDIAEVTQRFGDVCQP